MKVIKKFLLSKWLLFIIAFFAMFISISSNDFMMGSGDAAETWEVIKTFFSSNHYYSYVMYKGIYAFIPGILSYYTGLVLNINGFVLLKIFNSLIFSYLICFGLPNIVRYLFPDIKLDIWKYYLLGIVLFIFERHVFCFLSVDTTSCFVFVILINLCIKYINSYKKSKVLIFFIGIFFGLNMCFSGQYMISTYIVLVYFIYKIYITKKNNILKLLIAVCVLLIGVFLTKGIDIYYNKTIVEPARLNGEWIPTGHDWIITGYSTNAKIINYPALVPDNLTLKIVKDYDTKAYEIINNNGLYFDSETYFKLIKANPIKFIIRWCERLFLGIVNDYQNIFPELVWHFNTTSLFIMLVFIYISYYLFKQKYKNFKSLLCFDLIIYIAFLFPSLVPSFSHVENRYYFVTRIIIIAIPIMSNLLNSLIDSIKRKEVNISKINYNIIDCLVFILLGFIIYYAIYQSIPV